MGTRLKKNVPVLRFPEFEGDWFLGTLQDCIKQLDAGVSVNSDPQESIENDKGVLKTSCISMGEFEPSENKLVSDEYERTRLRESVKKDTIVICRSNTPTFVGASAYIDKDYPNLFLSDKLWAAKIKKDFSSKWVSYLLLQGKNRTLLCLRATGTSNSMKNISKDDLLTLPAYFPTQEEQEKIASFLGAVDNRLTQLRRKHELLQTYKRGVMQKIFSQQIRFKCDDGQPFPDWKETTLGKVSIFVNGKAHENDVVNNGRFVIVNSKFISTDGTVLKFSDKQLLPLFKNDIVMVMSDVPNGKALAKCFYIQEDNRFTLNQRICCLRTQKVDSKYLFYFINRNKYFLSLDSGVSQTNLRKEDVLSCPILQPSLLESEKIADFLTAIDQKIEAVAKQIDLTEQFKKGLLQKMFV